MGRHSPSARGHFLRAAAVSTGLCLALIVARPVVVGNLGQLFLLWNLVLAWVPFLVALGFYDRAKRGRIGATGAAMGVAWLLFLPNAPYIVTDLIHLPTRAAAPLWFDYTLYLVFAWTGLLLGLAALYLVHTAVARRLGSSVGWLLAGSTLALCGVGIYLGRVLRWNSWDVVTNPMGVMRDLLVPVVDPSQHATTTAVMLAIAGALACAYMLLFAFVRVRLERPEPG